MRKKIFAILLALCMVLTMMPSMAWADGNPAPVQLYAIWSNEQPDENGVITNLDGWTDRLDMEIGNPRYVRYFGYRSNENPDEFKVLSETPQGTGLTFEKTEDDVYRILADDSLNLGHTGEITVVQDGTTYKMDYEIFLPGIGAYKIDSIETSNLLKGRTFSYDDLDVAETDGKKVIYFIANDENVKNMHLAGEYDAEVVSSEKVSDNCLKVSVSKDVLNEWFDVVADLEWTDDEGQHSDVMSYDFHITGNVLYRIGFEEEEGKTYSVGDVVSAEWSDDRIYLSPIDNIFEYFGIPTGNENEFEIVKIESQSDKILINQPEDTAAYEIASGENAVLGEKYYINATVDGKTYKMQVYYQLPDIGAYLTPERNAESLIKSYSIPYNELLASGSSDGTRKLYFITNIDGEITNMRLLDNYSDNIISAEFHSATENSSDSAYLEVMVNGDVISEEFRVEVTAVGDGWRDTFDRYFRITGDLMYRLFLDSNSGINVGDRVHTEDWEGEIGLAPQEVVNLFAGIPTDTEDEFQIVTVTGSSPEISFEKLNATNGAYKIWANEDAEIGSRYYIEYKESAAEGKTYKLPVYYDYPFIGIYKEPEISEANYVNAENIYNEIKEQGYFYLIAREEGISLQIRDELPEGLALTEEEGHLKITIDNNFTEGFFDVEAWFEDEPCGNCGIWISKFYNPEEGDQEYVPADKTLLVCTKEGNDYQPIPLNSSEYGGIEEAAQFFLGEHSDRTFYVLYQNDAENLTLPLLEHYRDRTDNNEDDVIISKLDGTAVYDEIEYYVWEIKVKAGFSGMSRVGFSFDAGDPVKYELEPDNPRTKFMWILDEKCKEEYNEYSYENIIPCDKNPMSNGIIELGTSTDNWMIKNLNMSLDVDNDENAIYFVHPEGTKLHSASYIGYAYSIDGSGFGRDGCNGGNFNRMIDEELFDYDYCAGTITEDGRSMQITKATIKDAAGFLGHNCIVSELYLTNASGDIKHKGYARIRIEKGMNIVIEGDAQDVVTIDSEVNIVNQAIGMNTRTPLQFTQNGSRYTAFYDNACSQISDEGYGRVINFNVSLEPGYVVEKITDKDNNELAFYAERSFFYSPLDANGKEIYNPETISEIGWHNGISGSYDDNAHEDKVVIGAFHCIASCMQTYTNGLRFEEIGAENISDFVDFLLGNNTSNKPYVAKMKAAYTSYTVFFNPGLDDEVNEIVFHIKKADISDTEKVAAIDKSIRCQIQPLTDAGILQIEERLNALGYEGYEVLKAYEMSAENEQDNGLYNITIPMSELAEGTNLEDYRVVYIDENNIPYEMETTYVDGEGIVFTTGHFSTYVVIYRPNETPTPTPGTPGGGLPATSTDKVTQSGDTTTADLSGSTTSKGGETTTTVDQTTADKMVETAVKNNSEEIVINAVTKNESAASSTKAAEVVLTGETLQTIAEKTDADVVIQTNVAEVKLDNKTAEAVASQTGEGETVSIIAEKVKEEAKEVQFELKIVTSSGKVISDFEGGNVAVTVNVPKSLQGKKLVCVYIDDNGYMHKVEGTLNADGTYTFNTGHFSTYALMDEGEAEAAIEAQKEAVKALKPTLRSSQVKTKSGKKAIKLTWKGGEDIQLDGIEIYRSLKKSSGYGKEPFYTTTKTSYLNTSVKAGKKYYYKVKGFVTIDGEKVYTQYSTKAWRTVK